MKRLSTTAMVRRINSILDNEYDRREMIRGWHVHYSSRGESMKRSSWVRSFEGRRVKVTLGKDVSLGTYQNIMDVFDGNVSIYDSTPKGVVLVKTIETP